MMTKASNQEILSNSLSLTAVLL